MKVKKLSSFSTECIIEKNTIKGIDSSKTVYFEVRLPFKVSTKKPIAVETPNLVRALNKFGKSLEDLKVQIKDDRLIFKRGRRKVSIPLLTALELPQFNIEFSIKAIFSPNDVSELKKLFKDFTDITIIPLGDGLLMKGKDNLVETEDIFDVEIEELGESDTFSLTVSSKWLLDALELLDAGKFGATIYLADRTPVKVETTEGTVYIAPVVEEQ